jgi:hypothetical protein
MSNPNSERTIVLTATALFLRDDYGGRKTPLAKGMNALFRIPRWTREWIEYAPECELLEVNIDAGDWTGTLMGRVRIPSKYADLLRTGEQYELLDGHRIVCVGKIVLVSG